MSGLLFHRRVPILIGLGILLVVAITLVLVLPRQFQSQLDILVRNKLPLSARVNATIEETVDEERMQSEVALLHSPDLAAKVVDPDYPTQPDATHTAADLKRHQAAVALFSQQLLTTVAPNSNLIHVVVTAEDPHRAGELASRLLEVFFASQSEVAHPTAPTAFFIAEANQARGNWQEAQLALDGFLLAHPPTPVGSAAEISLQIAALKHQIQRNDEQIDAAIGRILTGERKLITIPAHPLDATNKSRNRSAAMPLLSVAQLNAMLAIYNDEQAILLTRPPTDAEAVRASLSLASQIADTNAAKRLAGQSPAPERDPAANSLWQATTDDIAQAGIELKTLYATRTALNNQLAGFQTSLNQVEKPGATLAGLQVKATTLQNTFRLADQRANEARIADAMDQQLRLNVAVASRPSFSNTATSPSPWLYGAAIFLAVLFLAACLTLFAGMYPNEYETEDPDDFDYGEDSSEDRHAHGFVPEVHEDPQQQIPFPSRIRTSQSGAFLYAAPGGAVPAPRTNTERHEDKTDPAFEPIPQAPSLSDILAHPIETPAAPHQEAPKVAPVPEEEEPQPHPSPSAEILHPHQYEAAAPEPESSTPADPPSFPSEIPPSRHNSGETHPAVPSFFAARPTASFTPEPEAEEAEIPIPAEPFFTEPTAPAAPFAGAPEVPTIHPEPVEAVEEPAAFSAVPTPEPEPIVTTPDPTPPWSQPAAEPRPTPPPAPSYWATVYEAAPAEPTPEPQPVAAAPEPVEPIPTPVEAVSEPIAPVSQPEAPAPIYTEPVSVAPPPATPEPPPLQPTAPVAAPTALPQSFTSTVRPDPFLTSHSSTLSATAFRFTPTQPIQPPKPSPTPQPAPAPAAAKAPPAPAVPPAPANPEPELILAYTSSDPIELVPDPVLPPVKPPYQAVRPQTPEPAPSPTPPSSPEVSEFPIFRPQKAAPPRPEPTAPPARPRTYEEMVRSLTYPEAAAPYTPPSRPAEPRQPDPIPEPPRPPADDDAPPFHYARRSAPPTPEPAPLAAPPQDDYQAVQNFIRRPPTPPDPAPPERPASHERDDRTVYHAAASPLPPQPPTPAPARASWIDVAPAPPPRGESEDPQKRAPDRISAIRESGASRISNVFDERGNRLTPSQRLKRGRPVPEYDKDGNVTYSSYLNDRDKNRY